MQNVDKIYSLTDREDGSISLAMAKRGNFAFSIDYWIDEDDERIDAAQEHFSMMERIVELSKELVHLGEGENIIDMFETMLVQRPY